MVNLMHLVEEGMGMEHSMTPIEEEILDEVYNEDLRGQLQETWKIIKPHPDSTKIGEVYSERIDEKLI